MKPPGRVALVTGASRGIGRAIALALSADGLAVAVNYRFDRAGAEDVVSRIRAAGQRAVAIEGDVADAAEAANVVTRAIKDLGDLHILVNNAGITQDSLIYHLEPGGWLDVMSVNFGGVVHCTQAAMDHFMSARDGVIVNISSVLAERASVGTSIYGASKAAINAFTRSSALELARFGVRVNAIAPGFTDTILVAGVDDQRSTPLSEQIPLGIYGKAEDVADAVMFLVGSKALYITGAVLTIDGGLTMTVDTRPRSRPRFRDRTASATEHGDVASPAYLQEGAEK